MISFRIFLAKWERYTAHSRRTSFTRGRYFQDIQAPTVAVTPWLPFIISASKHIQCTSEPIFNTQLWKAVPFTSAAGKWKIDVCRYVSNKIKLCHEPLAKYCVSFTFFQGGWHSRCAVKENCCLFAGMQLAKQLKTWQLVGLSRPAPCG